MGASAAQPATETQPGLLLELYELGNRHIAFNAARNQCAPRYFAHSMVFGRFSPRTEMADMVPIDLRKSFAGTAVTCSPGKT